MQRIAQGEVSLQTQAPLSTSMMSKKKTSTATGYHLLSCASCVKAQNSKLYQKRSIDLPHRLGSQPTRSDQRFQIVSNDKRKACQERSPRGRARLFAGDPHRRSAWWLPSRELWHAPAQNKVHSQHVSRVSDNTQANAVAGLIISRLKNCWESLSCVDI